MYMPQYQRPMYNYYPPNNYHPPVQHERMSLFGYGNQGITLKELLEDPKLQNPPPLNPDGKFDKLKGGVSPGGFDFSSAFLGPNIWGNPGSDDIGLEYMDLDEFLSENGIPVDLDEASKSNDAVEIEESPIKSPQFEENENSLDSSVTENINVFIPSPGRSSPPTSPAANIESPSASPASRKSTPSPVNFKVTEQDLALSSAPGVFRVGDLDHNIEYDDTKKSTDIQQNGGPLDPNLKAEFVGQEFDPKRRRFTEDELRPQPMIKKSRKVFVPDDCKDDKYWQRRSKNNVAAKRSRDARRIKENQIALRAAFLEQQTENLKEELEKMKKENSKLKALLSKYEGNS